MDFFKYQKINNYLSNPHYNLYVDDSKSELIVIKLKTFQDIYNFIINRHYWNDNHCYLLTNTKVFSTYFFNFVIDIVVLTINKNIIDICANFPVNQLTKYYSKSFFFLVLPRYSIQRLNIIISSKLIWKPNYEPVTFE